MFSPLILTYNPDGDPFLLYENFTWWNQGMMGGSHIVPKGSPTDLASIPPGMRSIFNRLGPSVRAAVVHDDLCRRQFTQSRKEADQMFYRALLDCGMSGWKAKLYYAGVRAGAAVGIGGKW